MSLSWIQALQKWNENSGTWCIPRKGSKQYDEVKALMNTQPTKQQIKVYKRVVKDPEPKPEPEPELVQVPVAQNYLERINNKYPEFGMKKLEEADKWIRDNFIDNKFASGYRFAMADNVATIKRRKDNPHASDRNRINEGLRRDQSRQEELRTMIKPLKPVFEKVMLTPILCEIFSNIVVDKNLIDMLDSNFKFRHTFALVYGIKGDVYTDTEQAREKIRNLVKNDSNVEHVRQRTEKFKEKKDKKDELIKQREQKKAEKENTQTRRKSRGPSEQHIAKVMKKMKISYDNAKQYIQTGFFTA